MGFMKKVIIVMMTLLVTLLLQDSCYGISVRRQVVKEVQKRVNNLENRLMTSISNACHKEICTSGMHAAQGILSYTL